MFGFAGRILHVDLSSGRIHIEEPPQEFYRKYWGGSAMGTYYLLRNTPRHADPLGPENTLSLMLSATTGVAISGQSRAAVTAKSPISDLIGDSQAGGFFPAELKFAGFDGLVLTGRSSVPVYLWICDGKAELRSAAHLWGKLTGETDLAIKQELGDQRIQVAQIGPAGEKLVRFAAIMSMSNRAFGRTGMGAVMGSKNLKAVAVRGHGKVNVFDRDRIARIVQRTIQNLPDSADMRTLQGYGTAGFLNYQNVVGGLPTRNFTSGVFERAENLSGERMAETILKSNDTCHSCIVRCKRIVETEYNGAKVDRAYGGPEYETLATFGSYCGVSELSAAALAHQICDQYGVDTIASGATIAFAMDCFERGLLDLQDTGGIELRFGNADAMLATLGLIVNRKGIGDILANGSARAAEMFGRGAVDLSIAAKNCELPAHMPQLKRSLALIYATNPFGADHQSSEHDPSYTHDAGKLSLERLALLGLVDPQPERMLNLEKVRFALYTQWYYSFMDSACLCQFVFGPSWQLLGPAETVELLGAVTGWDYTLQEIQRIGERRLNLLRCFNAREGAGRDRDTLPRRIFDQPLKGGPSDGEFVAQDEFRAALDDYYELAGWEKDSGTPSRKKLQELGLDWID